ncbi:Methyltransferase domain-containing protein [Nocardioides exalbidus]|uniref:Methyltransferase domain-containing protein n=1 Tax=Nocardioides exalbidus TaxID=402596 RepID=A0A1H4Y772_9ACTN|nr:class I SAM-dependent methyltransferase [Nocardioides exalbidus]SED13687.1 Methyltransferase domain-containing protein [Nocardioides exalbidus]
MVDSDYDQFAEAYASANASGFFNAWYEKPAMLRLLGDVRGKRILDAGCGSGPASVSLTEAGGEVSGFDLSAAMIEIARRNLPDADLRVHDLAEPLPWDDDTFDIVVASLVLHYLPNWSDPLSEFNRVLGPRGRLLISVNHPGAFPIVHPDLEYFGVTKYTEDYEFAGRSVDLTFFHRPLSTMATSFAEGGFRIVGIHEPPADPDTPVEVLPRGVEPGGQFLGFLFFDLEAR